jgi:hypothetical protein
MPADESPAGGENRLYVVRYYLQRATRVPPKSVALSSRAFSARCGPTATSGLRHPLLPDSDPGGALHCTLLHFLQNARDFSLSQDGPSRLILDGS